MRLVILLLFLVMFNAWVVANTSQSVVQNQCHDLNETIKNVNRTVHVKLDNIINKILGIKNSIDLLHKELDQYKNLNESIKKMDKTIYGNLSNIKNEISNVRNVLDLLFYILYILIAVLAVVIVSLVVMLKRCRSANRGDEGYACEVCV